MAIQARPFDFPYDGRLAPARTALLIIDMQIDFISRQGYFARMGYDPGRIRAIIPAVNAVSAAARAAGCPVILTRQGYRADQADMTPYDQWRRRRSGLHGTDVLLRGSPGFELDPQIVTAPGDIIVDKTANGAFTHTDLESILHARGVTHLLFAGCTTDVCVTTTLREARDRHFQNLLIEDACASGDQYAHDAAIHMVTVENGIWGTVSDSRRVISGLESARQA